MGKTFVLLPAFNEAASLATLIPDLLALGAAHNLAIDIIVVNDGSTDQTSTILQPYSQKAVHELRHTSNQGYGAALRTGYLWVLKQARDDDDVVSLDADCTHPVEFVPRLIEALAAGAEAVTASYTVPGSEIHGVPWARRLMSQTLNALFRFLIPFPGAKTYTNGFRGYRVAALRRVHRLYGDRLIENDGFPGGTELFIKVAQSGGRLAEIPFALHYERRGAASKIHIGRTVAGYLRLLGRAWMRFG